MTRRSATILAMVLLLSSCPSNAPGGESRPTTACSSESPRIINRFSSEGSITDAELSDEGLWVTRAPLQGRLGSVELIDLKRGDRIKRFTVGYVPLGLGLSQSDIWVANASHALVDTFPLEEQDDNAPFPIEDVILRIDRESGRILGFASLREPVSIATTTSMIWVLEHSPQSSKLIGFVTGKTKIARHVSLPNGVSAIVADGPSVFGVSGVGMSRASLWSLRAGSSQIDVRISDLDQSHVFGVESRPLSLDAESLWVTSGRSVARLGADSSSFAVTIPIPFSIRALSPAQRGGVWVAGREGFVALVCRDGSKSGTLRLDKNIDVIASSGSDAWLGTSSELIHVRA